MVSLWLGQRLHVRGLPSANADVYFIKPKKEKKNIGNDASMYQSVAIGLGLRLVCRE